MKCEKYLKKRIHDNMSLTELVDVFEKACNKFKKEQDMLLFEADTYSFTGKPMFYFSLVRQFPNKEEEYCQIHLDILYSPDQADGGYSESIWDEDIDGDFFDHIRNSEIYTRLKGEKIAEIDLYMDET